MRKPPVLSVPDLDKRSDLEQIILTRRYRLLTPLFGGGVEAGEVDQNTPVRGSTIRGQLRFWWRATQGGRFNGSLAKMKEAEDRLWGSTQSVSQVSTAVIGSNSGSPFASQDNRGNPAKVGDPGSIYSYVAFPLKGDNENPAGEVREGVTFALRISFPSSMREEVRAALWAWDTFGGVGARTRRGFGALACEEVSIESDDAGETPEAWRWSYTGDTVQDELAADLAALVSDGDFPADVPHLSRLAQRSKITAVKQDQYVVWRHLFGRLRDFRQSRSGSYGRSHWPEPDVIRKLTDQSLDRHEEPVHTPPIDKFPRAAFGLPILFKFKDDSDRRSNSEPRQTSLELDGQARLASPLILRPLACADGGYVGLATILDGSQIAGGQAVLKDPQGDHIVDVTLDDPGETAALAAVHPLYNGDPDILQAFLDIL